MMRATIRREESVTGVFRTKTIFNVIFRIEMTEEEIARTKHVGIADQYLFTLEDREPAYGYPIKWAFKASETTLPFPTLSDANDFEEHLKEKLALLSSHLKQESSHGRAETLEF